MIIRNRLEEFYNKAQKGKFQSTKFKISSQPEYGTKMTSFLKKLSHINKTYKQVEIKIDDARSLQKLSLELNKSDAALYPLYAEIRHEIALIVKTLHDLEYSFNPETLEGLSTDREIYALHLRAQKKTIAEFIINFYNMQDEYKSKAREQVHMQAMLAGADLEKTDIDDAINMTTEAFMQTIFPDYDMSHQYLHEVRERHRDFMELEKSIAALHEMFYDLALVIQVDFGLMDRIDKSSTYTDTLVVQGLNNVNSYRSSLRMSRSKTYMALGCVAFALGIIALIIYVIVTKLAPASP